MVLIESLDEAGRGVAYAVALMAAGFSFTAGSPAIDVAIRSYGQGVIVTTGDGLVGESGRHSFRQHHLDQVFRIVMHAAVSHIRVAQGLQIVVPPGPEGAMVVQGHAEEPASVDTDKPKILVIAGFFGPGHPYGRRPVDNSAIT